MRVTLLAAVLMLLTLGAEAQSDGRGNKAVFVTVDPLPPVEMVAGKTEELEVRFRVKPGYHINSNKPMSELLIPTEIKFEPLKGITVGKVTYPAGHDFALSFAPQEKMSVYEGEVAVTVPVSALRFARLGAYTLNGKLTYQACNDTSCFPPKTAPVTVNVTIKKK